MGKDRFLIGIFVGIGVLVVAALILFFARRGQDTYVDDSTPQGVLRNYVLALQKRDYERAYGYLADQSQKPDLNQFRQAFLSYQSGYVAGTAVEINDTYLDEQNQTAIIQVTLLRGSQDLFGSGYRSSDTATLVRQGGAWKISQVPYPYAPPDFPQIAPTRQPSPTVTPTEPKL